MDWTNVDFIQGDFTEDAIVQQVFDWLGGEKFDVIISDIAPNLKRHRFGGSGAVDLFPRSSRSTP